MAELGDFDWRARAIALAALGSASVARGAFDAVDIGGPEPFAMQVLVATGLRETLIADRPVRVGTGWLAHALGVDHELVVSAVSTLVAQSLLERRSGHEGEIAYELAEAHSQDAAEREVPLQLTDRGLAVVEGWLARVVPQFRGWPPDAPGVDDADSA